jgi:hypothetical protein
MRNTQFCACVAAIPDLHKRYQRRHAGRTQVHLRDHHPPATDRWKQKAHQVVKYATRLHTSYARAFIRIHFSRVVMWTAPESPLHTFVLKLNIFDRVVPIYLQDGLSSTEVHKCTIQMRLREIQRAHCCLFLQGSMLFLQYVLPSTSASLCLGL